MSFFNDDEPEFLFIEFYRNPAYLALKEVEFELPPGGLGTITADGFEPGPMLPAAWSNMNLVQRSFAEGENFSDTGEQRINGKRVYVYRHLTLAPLSPNTFIFEYDVNHIMDEEYFDEKLERWAGPRFWWRGFLAYSGLRSLSSSDLGNKVKAWAFNDPARPEHQPVCIVIYGY